MCECPTKQKRCSVAASAVCASARCKYISPLRGPDGLGVDEKSVAFVQHQGQRSQVMTLRVVELFRRPLGRPPRVGFEILQVLQTDRRRVVVAQKHRIGQLAHRIEAGARIGAIADDIAQA